MTNHPLEQPPHVTPPPAWYDDPQDPSNFRYWDGTHWTDDRAPKRAPQPVVQAWSPTYQAPVAEASSPTYQPPIAPVAPSIIQPAASGTPGWPWPRLIAALAAIAIMIGSVTSWATVSASYMSVDIKGTDGDGVITVVGGIVLLVLVFARKYLAGIIISIITGGILVSDLVDLSGIAGDDSFGTVSVGWGLYLATAGAVTAVVSLIMLKRSQRAQAQVG